MEGTRKMTTETLNPKGSAAFCAADPVDPGDPLRQLCDAYEALGLEPKEACAAALADYTDLLA